MNGVQVPRTLEDLCRPERMALIVYDMQIGIFFMGDAIQTNIKTFCRVLAQNVAA
jgi:hypothetical protein